VFHELGIVSSYIELLLPMLHYVTLTEPTYVFVVNVIR